MIDQLFSTPICRHVPRDRHNLLMQIKTYVSARGFAETSLANSTRRGYQSHPTFFNNQDLPVMKLREEIMIAFKNYFPSLKQSITVPSSKAELPKEFELWGWITSYDHNGWNAPHIHPRSLISGVYWVETPTQILENKNGDYAGWLGFQDPRAGSQTWPLPDPLTHFFVPPEEGMLVLFPSYLSHFVPPFSGGGQRTSIAFNMRHKVVGH